MNEYPNSADTAVVAPVREGEAPSDEFVLSTEIRALKKQLEEQQRANIEVACRATVTSVKRARQHREELAKIRVEAEKARLDLERTRSEVAAAARREAGGEAYRAEAERFSLSRWFWSNQAAPRVEKWKQNTFRGPKFILQIAALSLMCAAIAMFTVASITPRPQNSPSANLPGHIKLSSTGISLKKAFDQSSSAEGIGPEDSKPDPPFVQSIDRLGQAFDSFPDRQPSEIVREINRGYTSGALPCPMEWNTAGEPAVLLSDAQKLPASILGTIHQCASAVEQYRLKTLKDSR